MPSNFFDDANFAARYGISSDPGTQYVLIFTQEISLFLRQLMAPSYKLTVISELKLLTIIAILLFI